MRDCFNVSAWLCASVIAGLLASGAPHRAHAQEQFLLIDETFTTTTQNTMESQFGITPLAKQPSDWTSPVDFSKGSIYVRFEILEKPSSRMTLCNVCFEHTNTLTCMPYPPPYTATGVFTSAPTMDKFWNYDVYDWTKKPEHVYVVLKDENGLLVQGDSQFYPSKMRVTVTVVPPGAKYVEMPLGTPTTPTTNAGTGSGAGGSSGTGPVSTGGTKATAGSSGSSQGSGSAGRSSPAPTTSVGAAGSASVTTPGAAVGGTSSPAVGARAGAGAPGQRDIRDYVDPGSNCSVRSVGSSGAGLAWIWVCLGLSLARLRRSRTRTLG